MAVTLFSQGAHHVMSAINWLPTFFNASYFVFGRRKKRIQVSNNTRVSKWWERKNIFFLGELSL